MGANIRLHLNRGSSNCSSCHLVAQIVGETLSILVSYDTTMTFALQDSVTTKLRHSKARVAWALLFAIGLSRGRLAFFDLIL